MNDDQDNSILLYDILVTMLEQSWIHKFPALEIQCGTY